QGTARSEWVWKSFDWAAMERLHEKGLISDPVGRAKSVVLTDEGLEKAAVSGLARDEPVSRGGRGLRVTYWLASREWQFRLAPGWSSDLSRNGRSAHLPRPAPSPPAGATLTTVRSAISSGAAID